MSHRGYTITKQIKEQRRKFAEERQAEYDKLTLQQKIDRLPPEPGAKKQRARLLALLEESKKPKQAQKTEAKVEKTDATVEADEKPFNKKSKKNK
jgi:hypothetical protein